MNNTARAILHEIAQQSDPSPSTVIPAVVKKSEDVTLGIRRSDVRSEYWRLLDKGYIVRALDGRLRVRLTLLDQYRYAFAAQRPTVFSYTDGKSRVWVVYGPGSNWLGSEHNSWNSAMARVEAIRRKFES